MGEHSARLTVVLRLVAAAVACLLVAPTLVVVPLSFTSKASFVFPPEGWSLRWYQNFFASAEWIGALTTSLKVAGTVTVTATVLGTAAAVALTRSRFRGVGAVNGLLLVPIVVPQIVAAVAIYSLFLHWGLAGTFAGFVAAHTVLALPFVVIAVSTSLRGYDLELDRAASVLGATPLRRFRRVTLPLIAPGISSGAVFAFVISLDEVVVAYYLQSPTLQTLPVQMFGSVTVETDPTIAAVSTLVLVVTTTLILLPQLARRYPAGDE